MKAISLWQPWASLWCSPCKVHETRHWPTSHRGWLLVHATKKIVFELPVELEDIICDEFGPHWGMELPRGALVGIVKIVACHRTEVINEVNLLDHICGDFSPGRFGWERSEFVLFDRPIPYIGRQGMFDVPDHLLPSPPPQSAVATEQP